MDFLFMFSIICENNIENLVILRFILNNSEIIISRHCIHINDLEKKFRRYI
jgi:hypothetical protein